MLVGCQTRSVDTSALRVIQLRSPSKSGFPLTSRIHGSSLGESAEKLPISAYEGNGAGFGARQLKPAAGSASSGLNSEDGRGGVRCWRAPRRARPKAVCSRGRCSASSGKCGRPAAAIVPGRCGGRPERHPSSRDRAGQARPRETRQAGAHPARRSSPEAIVDNWNARGTGTVEHPADTRGTDSRRHTRDAPNRAAIGLFAVLRKSQRRSALHD